jgi:hypothetical protein
VLDFFFGAIGVVLLSGDIPAGTLISLGLAGVVGVGAILKSVAGWAEPSTGKLFTGASTGAWGIAVGLMISAPIGLP